MGYDMYLVDGLTEAEAVAKQAAEDEFNAAVKVRDTLKRSDIREWKAAQAEVDAAYDRLDRANVAYFRLNIWGMGRCRGYMEERGMVYDADAPSEWPEYPDDADDAAEAEYEAACLPLQAEHPDGGDTIPMHKLCDNSGWLVTPEECKAALAHNALHDPPTYEDEETHEIKPVVWWPEWIAFLELAVDRGGFRVH